MRHEQFEHQNVANTTENERFGVQMLQNVFEMAASSSKMLQIARETDRTGDPKKDPKTEKQKKTKQFQTHIYIIYRQQDGIWVCLNMGYLMGM